METEDNDDKNSDDGLPSSIASEGDCINKMQTTNKHFIAKFEIILYVAIFQFHSNFFFGFSGSHSPRVSYKLPL